MRQRNTIVGLVCAAALLGTPRLHAQGTALDPVVSRQILMRLAPGASIDAIHAAYDLRTLRTVASRNTYLLETNAPIPDDQLELLADQIALEQPATVVWAEANYAGDAPEGSARSFFFNRIEIAAPYLDQPAWDQVNLSGAQTQSTGSGVVVAVVDSGVDSLHPALAGRLAPGGWNILENSPDFTDVGNAVDDDGDGDVDEMTGHGTHVAGIIAHIAPDALILPIKVLDSDGNTDIFLLGEAIYYAMDWGADVINVSIGSTYRSQMIEEALAEARAAGVTVVAAAGNLNRQKPEEYPAMFRRAIAVASVNTQDVRSGFSNYGPNVDLCAPGEAVYGPLPDGDYGAWNGTSMATPIVSAGAALVLARHPNWTMNASRVDQVTGYLRASAVSIDLLNPGFDGLLGAGRVNLATAVSLEVALAALPDAPAGPAPECVAAADFNRDHRMDLVVANPNASSLTVIFADESGGFHPPQTLFVGGSPTAVVVSDFNGDGAPDLAAVDENQGRVILLRNEGLGAFGAPAVVSIGGRPDRLVAIDFDNDDDPDLAVSDSLLNRVRILTNHGGDFAAGAPISTGIGPEAIAAGDLDGDAFADIVTADRDSNRVSFLRNLGGDGFAAAVSIGSVAEPRRAITVGDFDADGDLDVVAASHLDRTIVVFWNDGNATFPTSSIRVLPAQRRPLGFDAGDLDCDGDTDLVALSENNNGIISVFLNDGQSLAGGALEFATGRAPQWVITADMDRDGDFDVISANRGSNTVTVLENLTCTQRILGDMNCDGVVSPIDIAGFVLALTDPAGYAASYPNCMASNADVNGDGLVSPGDISGFVLLLAP